MRRRLATDLHDELGAGLAEIAILSEVAKRKPDEVAVLDSVAQRARGMRVALSDIAWTIDPRRDRLSDLVHRARDLAMRILESQECRVEFSAPSEEQLQEVELAPDVRRHLLLFFKEALTNVARHSGASEVHLEVAMDRVLLIFRIEDNGRGFREDAATEGQGLSNLRYRAREIGGRVDIQSSPGQGCRIELIVSRG